MFPCSKVINAFKRQNSWTDTFRRISKLNLSQAFLRKTCVASITQRFLVPVSTVSARTPGTITYLLCPKNSRGGGGGTSRKIGRSVRHASWNPYPISDQDLWFSLPCFRRNQNLIPYFRPEALEPGAWPERVTSCYGTYTVVGVNIKREMVLFPNDEEVANSSKKINPIQDECTNHTVVEIDTLFRTKTAKNIPFGAAHAYITYIRDYPPRRKRVGDYESSCLRKRD